MRNLVFSIYFVIFSIYFLTLNILYNPEYNKKYMVCCVNTCRIIQSIWIGHFKFQKFGNYSSDENLLYLKKPVSIQDLTCISHKMRNL